MTHSYGYRRLPLLDGTGGYRTFVQLHSLDQFPGNFRLIPNILIGGHGRAGKDTMADWLAANTPLRHPGSLSTFLTAHVVAFRLSVTPQEAAGPAFAQARAAAFATRHEDRQLWYEVGNRLRDGEPGALVDAALAGGELVVGVRDLREVELCRELHKVDLLVWVDNPRGPNDPTVKFTADDCDVVIENNGTYAAFYSKIAALCRFARIPLNNPAVDPTVNTAPGVVSTDG